MLIMCPNAKMVAIRVKLKADLLSLCATEEGLREHPIPELSQSVLWSLLLLCTTSESFPIQARRSARRREALDAVGTRDELPIFDRDEVVSGGKLAIATGRGMDGSAEAVPQGRGHGRTAGCKSGRVDLCAYQSGVYGTSQGAEG